MIVDELDVRAKRIAAMMGPAPGTERVTGKQEIELWDERDPNVDVLMEHQNFMAQGYSPEDAQAAATVKAYPNRGVMVLNAGATDEERVKYAQKMKRLSEKAKEGGEQDVSGPY